MNWQCLFSYNDQDVNECYNLFISVIKNVYEQSFPLTRLSRRASKDKKWFSKSLKACLKRKDYLFKKYVMSKSATDEMKYNNYKRIYRKVIRKAEVLYYNKKFDTEIHNSKQISANLNQLCSFKQNKNNSRSVEKLTIDGNNIVHSSDICSAFNDYFCNIGPNLVKNLPSGPVQFSDFMPTPTPLRESIFVQPVTASEVYSLIMSLKRNKSAGEDGVSPRLIRDNVHLFIEPLAYIYIYIYYASLMSGEVPLKLKIAKVIPIYKKGDESLASNYRTISLLSVFNKLLEKIVFNRLYTFCEKHHILYKHQFGFRRNHSTSLALIKIMDTCYKNFDAKMKGIGIYFDLQKAFDTVDHNILLKKLYSYGIRGVMHGWLENYLRDRKQYTVVNKCASALNDIVCGVPQGSVLGPLLFLIYVNDIHSAVSDGILKLFADDTNLFLFDPDLKTLERKANDCLRKMEVWFIANKLTLNK